MSRLIKNLTLVADAWREATEGPLPEGDVIVPLARFAVERDALLARDGRLGVRLGPDDDPAGLAGDLARLDLIALSFPKFTDGRAYSQARLLRERLGFAGELRAVGDVLRDQLLLMARCGFDAFELRADKDPDDALGAFADYSVAYQAPAAPAPSGRV
jgi:uncharacterized protein (DUF934 family)